MQVYIYIFCHHFSYYLDGRTATASDFINSTIFDTYKEKIAEFKAIIKGSKTPNLPVWLGEGADAKAGGARNLSDTYVSGFL